MAPAPLFVVLRVWCHLHTEHFEVQGVERVGALGLSSPVSFMWGRSRGGHLKFSLVFTPGDLLNVTTKSLR